MHPDTAWVLLIIVGTVAAMYLFARYRPAPRTKRHGHRANERNENRNHRLVREHTESEKSSVAHLPEARVLYVIDGDTVVVRKQEKRVKVRLASIDCPEDGQPWGDTAKYGLVKLIGGRSVKMEEHGTDLYGRTVATLYVRTGDSNWLNVNERMVVLGHAWVMRAYCGHLSSEQTRRLINGETWAKTRKVGLWKTPKPIPPWQWRRESVVEQSR